MTRSLFVRGLKLFAVALLFVSAGLCQGQQKTAATESNKNAASDTADTYRLDVTIREVQEGKVISSRNYSTLVKDSRYGAPRTMRVGSRLPVETAASAFSYLDVGTNLTFRVWTMDGQLILSTAVEVSSIAPTEPNPNVKLGTNPVLRQLRTDQEAAIPLGKPTLLDSIDDPSSNHRFQIEVTATKEKV